MLPEKIYSFRETPCQQVFSMCLYCWLFFCRHRDRPWPLANHLSSMENLFSYKQHFQTGRMNLPSFLKCGGLGHCWKSSRIPEQPIQCGTPPLSSCLGQGTLVPTWKPADPSSVKTHSGGFPACVSGKPCQPSPPVSEGTALGRAVSRVHPAPLEALFCQALTHKNQSSSN